MVTKLANWAGNYEYSTGNIHRPETVEQLQTLVKQHKKFRVLGTRHSFNSIADSTENLISLERFQPNIEINRERASVSLAANVVYGELARIIDREGFALHNLGSLLHISVAGACATATHGSGVGNKNLAAAVSALEIVTADGDLVRLSREHDGDLFDGAVVGLGALGIVTRLELRLEPTFDMRQYVYLNLPFARLEDHFDEIMSSAYSVSLFPDWQGDTINQVWVKARVGEQGSEPQPGFFGAVPATRKLHPIGELSPENCTDQLGMIGAWYTRLPHFRFDAIPSAGDELQTEYFVPRSQAVAALRAVRSLSAEIAPHLLFSEIRTVAADNLWMSPSYHQDSVAIHFTWQPDWTSVKALLPSIEAKLAPFAPRPHWGKLFTIPPQQIQSRYEKLADFRSLIQKYDPQGKLRNAFVDAAIFGS